MTRKVYYEYVEQSIFATKISEVIVGVGEQKTERGNGARDQTSMLALVFEETIFFPRGGGQPGDTGNCILSLPQTSSAQSPDLDSSETKFSIAIKDTIIERTLDGDERILHLVDRDACKDRENFFPLPQSSVELRLDTKRRWRLMRMHTALHLLCASLPYDVTGGAIRLDKSHLDFDTHGESIDKTAVSEKINHFVRADVPVETFFMPYEEFLREREQNPSLVRTAAVSPPVDRDNRIRMVRIGDEDAIIDLQACGGTHVPRTGRIGEAAVVKVENKGKRNRRVRLTLA